MDKNAIKKLLYQKSFRILIILASLLVVASLPNGKVYPNGSAEMFWQRGTNLDSLIIGVLHLGYPTATRTNERILYFQVTSFFYIFIGAFIVLSTVMLYFDLSGMIEPDS